MNIDKIRQKIEDKNSKNTGEKVDYKKIYWRPEVGTHEVRIVPSKFFPDDPFKEVKIHYALEKNMPSLSNFGKQDPVEELVAELRKTSDKDNWSLSGKISPKTRVLVPVIVRGEEEAGVRLWNFGTQLRDAFYEYATDEEVGDFTDITSGRDFKVTVKEIQGKKYNDTSIMPKMKTSVLTKDKAELDKWLNEQPNPLEVLTEYSYETIKAELQKFLNPTEEVEESVETGSTTGSTVSSTTEYAMSTTSQERKKSSNSKIFEEMFNVK